MAQTIAPATLDPGSIAASVELNRFPPSFDDNPWSYGYALIGLMIVCALAAKVLLGWATEGRRQRELDQSLDNLVVNPRPRGITPFRVYRWSHSLLLIGYLIGALPDVVSMLAWGDTSNEFMAKVLLIDRLCDGSVVWPVVAFALLLACFGQVVEHKLQIDVPDQPAGVSRSIGKKFPWAAVRKQLRLIGMLFLIAAGVTFAKSFA